MEMRSFLRWYAGIQEERLLYQTREALYCFRREMVRLQREKDEKAAPKRKKALPVSAN